MKKIFVLFLVGLIFTISSAESATVQGYAYIEGQSDHSGIEMTLNGTLITPSMNLPGMLLLLSIIGFFLARKQKRVVLTILVCVGLSVVLTHLNAAPKHTVQTVSDGYYSFGNVSYGDYRLVAVKECYVTVLVDNIEVQSDVVNIENITLGDLNDHNEALMPVNMKQIIQAQTYYNNYSSPHTYTCSLACLASGNGAGGVGFLNEDFADGFIDGYQILTSCGPPDVMGSIWSWSATAIPVSYGCTGHLTYYVDEQRGCPACMIQEGDLGGAPGDQSLPFVCESQQPRLAHLSMQFISVAETDYNNNSSPHTYIGDFACLTSGNGAGQVRFLCIDLEDGEMCNYVYSLSVSEPVGGSSWSWECTAWPIVYGGDSVLTFYIDESTIVRAEDIGGGPGDESLPTIGNIPDGCP
ncbi:carboxypeptidase-like regulatory domain-containing protein [bacterium]|nr:carboxypeptidase-like regulatory domain-containing protein [bacterium]